MTLGSIATVAALAGVLVYLSDFAGGWVAVRRSSFTKKSIPSMAGKVVVITGGNQGIGFQAVTLLATAGATVILACRTLEKGRVAASSLPPEVAKNVVVMQLDLGRLSSILEFAKTFRARYEQLHVLNLNAGLAKTFMEYGGWSLTPDGLEEMVGVTFLGHFLLTQLLLPVLRRTDGSRVIGQSSVAGANSYLRGIDPQTWTSRPKDFQDWKQYGQAKLAVRLFMRHLQHREPKVLCVSCHPGVVESTTLMHQAGAGLLERFYSWTLFTFMAQKHLDGGLQTAWLATVPAEKLEGGAMYGPIGRKLTWVRSFLQRAAALQAPLPMNTDFPQLWEEAEKAINATAGKKLIPIEDEK
mmetsp:Transcript_55882/g.130814  ORF Transcript_55882/g.130814 Transcript_55882/m.130814 type:complete len:355 (-) Transcript_55882:218-1282(-)